MADPVAPARAATETPGSGSEGAPQGRPAGAGNLWGRLTLLLALLLLAAGALAFRLPELDTRPMHGDEAVHAFKFRELWETGRYHYDPNEFHGPTLYYATLPVVRLAGLHRFVDVTERHYRLAPVIFGAALVLLLLLMADGLGWRATLWAGVLLALSPAFVFYSRYYIQETFLAFFTLAALGTGWRYLRSGRPAWLAACGACAGLMVASKETAVLAFAAAGVPLFFAARARRRSAEGEAGASMWQPRHVLLAALVGLGVGGLFLSGMGSNLAGPVDFLRSFTPWVQRAKATDLHQHPWFYYLSVLAYTHRERGPVFTEGLILALALVGIAAAFLGRTRRESDARPTFARYVAVYTLLLTLAYTLIPYKTPWCLLSFHSGFILLAGVGAAALVRAVPGWFLKGIVTLALLAGCFQLGGQARRAATEPLNTDSRNPYVYAQTVPDIFDVQSCVEGVARACPAHEKMVVQVFAADAYYWPLPWYLRRFENIGYWMEVPADISAPVVVASSEYEETLTRRIGATYTMAGFYGLRPRVFLQVWVQKSLWAEYLKRGGASGQ